MIPDSKLILEEQAKAIVRIYETDKFSLDDTGRYCATIYSNDDTIDLEDWVYNKMNLYLRACELKLYDSASININLYDKTDIKLRDKIKIVYN